MTPPEQKEIHPQFAKLFEAMRASDSLAAPPYEAVVTQAKSLQTHHAANSLAFKVPPSPQANISGKTTAHYGFALIASACLAFGCLFWFASNDSPRLAEQIPDLLDPPNKPLDIFVNIENAVEEPSWFENDLLFNQFPLEHPTSILF